uniref:Auxin-responsive protein n=1 Tax=Hordeum vulgare subsp. vulgare TaxID=112509 RepID=A0A8I6XEU1_HORVV
MKAMGRKRLTQSMTVKRVAEECCTMNSIAVKLDWVVYTADGERFEVPLAYLGTTFFRELLRMSQEEFGFASGNDGRMMLICDTAVAEYAMCLLRRDAPVEVVMAFVCSIERPCCFDSGVVAPCVGLIQHVAVC